MPKIVVYTAITNHYDTLKEPPIKLWKGVDFVAFLDHTPVATSWQIRTAASEFSDPWRNVKIHKILPHVFFPEATYSLWIDGSVEMNFNFSVQQLIDVYLKEHDLAVFKHPERQCIYAEGEECIRIKKDDPAVIQRQMAAYRNENYPPNNGLVECAVLLRRHTGKVRQFNEAWYQEIKHNSRRDQLSFNYAARKTGLEFCHLPESLRHGAGSMFQIQPHAAEMWLRASVLVEHRLHRKKSWANRLILIFSILAFAWIPAAIVLIWGDRELRPISLILWRLSPLAFIPLCGVGICCRWRSSLKQKIKELKSRRDSIESPHPAAATH
jgi:hypothetical protein